MRMVNKQTIALVEAKPGDTYAKLARGVPIRRNAEETLRLINGHYPRGTARWRQDKSRTLNIYRLDNLQVQLVSLSTLKQVAFF